jgi:hypothetical protein
VRVMSLRLVPGLVALSLTAGGSTRSSDFEAFMGTPLPAHVTVLNMDGNWGPDPCGIGQPERGARAKEVVWPGSCSE